jgi:hypothetical protein
LLRTCFLENCDDTVWEEAVKPVSIFLHLWLAD